MHIVYVISPGGGPEAHVKTLLPWLEQHGHRASIVYSRRSVQDVHRFPPQVHVELAPGGSMHYYLGKLLGKASPWPRRLRGWERALSVRRAVGRIHRSRRVDVVEVTEGDVVTLLNRHWTTVLRAHGSDWTFRHFCRDGDPTGDDDLIQQQARQMRRADAVVALSAHLADHLSEFCGYPRGRISVVPYGIDLVNYSPDGPTAQVEGSPVLLSVGRLQHRKGTDVLMRALPAILGHFPMASLYLLGHEAEYTERQLRAFLPEEVQSRVFFRGFVPHERLADFYRAATLYIAPTQYETFGYTILEAMACGKPVVSSPVGAVPELLQDGVQGAFSPFNDHHALARLVVQLLSRPESLRALGAAGRRRASSYDVQRVGPQMESLYLNRAGNPGLEPIRL